MKSRHNTAIFFSILAAALYAISSPFSKLLLEKIPAAMMASLLYLGAGIGLFIVGIIQKKTGRQQQELPLTKKEMPYTIAMVGLDIAAPIFLMIGLTMTTAANASLLNNFEIAATSIIAFFVFKEAISKRLWLAIFLVTLASIILSVQDIRSFSFSFGSIFVLLACVCWGFENNCTRMLSSKNPLQIVVIKGIFSGTGSLIIALVLGERVSSILYIFAALLMGFVAYGMSIFFYIFAQRELGAAKTSAYYAIAPFIGVALSFVIFKEFPSTTFILALLIMIAGTYFASSDTKASKNS
ncbi:MAG TPA: EamA/RhaT family transporter [Clostridiales bacterium]|nr:EamA/RhaT family transporter [Clostridiales bacterium]